MSAKAKKHEILVPKDKLATRSLSPSSEELFDNMHLTSCELAIKSWKPNWICCPVCSEPFKLMVVDGIVEGVHYHKTRKELLV